MLWVSVPDRISENATQAILEQTVRSSSAFETLNFNQGHTIPILIQRSSCSDSYIGFRHYFRISLYHSSAEEKRQRDSLRTVFQFKGA